MAEAVVTVQRDWGDRTNRKHARLKYTIEDRGLDAFRAEVEKRAGVTLEPPKPFTFTSTGDRYGWTEGENGKAHLTLFVENGRIQDVAGGAAMLTGLRRIAEVHDGDFRLTANQNVIVANVAPEERAAIEAIVAQYRPGAAGVRPAAQLHGLRRAADLRARAGRERALSARPDRRARRAARRARPLRRRHRHPHDRLPERLRAALSRGDRLGRQRARAATTSISARRSTARGCRSSMPRICEHDGIIAALDPLFAAYAKEREPGERFGDFVIRAGFVAQTGNGATSTPTWEPSAPHERSRPSARRAHHLPLLRGRVRRARDAGRAGRRGDRGRSATIRRISGGCARRARRSAKRSASARGCLHPMLRRDGALVRTDWDTALDQVADGFKRIVERDGPNAVAFYLSGQLLTEDYYVANKLMKGFLGSANVDTNSRLCMASSVAGHRRAFGADTVPGLYEDLDQADLIVLVGSNAAWCHPVLFQRMQQNRRERGAKLVVIDPRRTATAEEADLHLAIKPGMDTALFSGLLVRLADRDAFDRRYVAQHTVGFEAALQRATEIAPDIEAVARITGLDAADIQAFYALFAATPRTVTCYSQGVNQSAQGTDKVNAIINCHLATGRIGKPGMGPFSLTGQPNAMGGREVGGLANQLAAHMNFSPAEIDRVRRFWNAPHIATHEGLKAVQMFEAIERGEIKALWVMATNPAVSLPRAGAVREALKKLELFVVSENVLSNDTRECRRAHSASRRGVGRERRHGHELRAAHLAPAPLPAPAGRSEARLVDRHARWRGAWDLPMRSPTRAPPIFSASTPRCRLSRMTARAISISARSPTSATQRSTRSIR